MLLPYPFYTVQFYIIFRPKRARWFATFILPAYFILSVFSDSYTNKASNYFDKSVDSSEFYGSTRNYEDAINVEEDYIDFLPLIPSKVITTPYLSLKIPFTSFKETALFEQDSTLTPEKDRRGYGFNGRAVSIPGLNFNFSNNYDKKNKPNISAQ